MFLDIKKYINQPSSVHHKCKIPYICDISSCTKWNCLSSCTNGTNMDVCSMFNKTQCLTRVFIFRLQACPQKQPKAHSAHPQNVHENQVQSASSSWQQLRMARPALSTQSSKPRLFVLQRRARRARRRQRNGHGQTRRRGAARRPAGRPSRRTAGAAIAAKPN